MSTFEIHVYRGGAWAVDSYFDDRDLALSEAERLSDGRRFSGVRVMQEDYDEDANKSKCRVVFSKVRQTDGDQGWRAQARNVSSKRRPPGGSKAADSLQSRRGRPSPQKNKTSLYIVLIVALIILVAGAAAMIGLQEIAKYL